MNLGIARISRRTVTIAVAFVGLVSLVLGAHAALNKRSLDAAKAIATEHTGSIGHDGFPRRPRYRQWSLPGRVRAAGATHQ